MRDSGMNPPRRAVAFVVGNLWGLTRRLHIDLARAQTSGC